MLYVAQNLDVLHRVLALRLVAQVPAVQFAGKAEFVKRALLEERWADAVLAWIDRYEIAVDVFENGPDLYTEQDVGGRTVRFAPTDDSVVRRARSPKPLSYQVVCDSPILSRPGRYGIGDSGSASSCNGTKDSGCALGALRWLESFWGTRLPTNSGNGPLKPTQALLVASQIYRRRRKKDNSAPTSSNTPGGSTTLPKGAVTLRQWHPHISALFAKGRGHNQ